MRREKKRVIISFALTACMVFTTEFGSLAADTQSDAQPIETINHETTISPLAETWNEIPETAAVAEATQVWHGKALANVESEADVLAEAVDGGEVVGKMYTNTILTVEERGDVWSKVSSGSVVGYVKNEMLAFGSDAVARAAAIDMTNPQDAKTLEEIAAEEAAKKAAEEEAARKAAEEAAPEELMPSVCWSQLEKLLPRMALPEALQLESASEAAAAPVRRRTVRRVIFIGKTSCSKQYRCGPAGRRCRKRRTGAALPGRKHGVEQTDLI